MEFEGLQQEMKEIIEHRVNEVYVERLSELSLMARSSNMNYLSLLLSRMADNVESGNTNFREMNEDLKNFGYELMIKYPIINADDNFEESFESIEDIEFHLVEKIFIALDIS